MFAVHLLAAAIYDIRTDYKKDTNFFRVFLRECRCPFLCDTPSKFDGFWDGFREFEVDLSALLLKYILNYIEI